MGQEVTGSGLKSSARVGPLPYGRRSVAAFIVSLYQVSNRTAIDFLDIIIDPSLQTTDCQCQCKRPI